MISDVTSNPGLSPVGVTHPNALAATQLNVYEIPSLCIQTYAK